MRIHEIIAEYKSNKIIKNKMTVDDAIKSGKMSFDEIITQINTGELYVSTDDKIAAHKYVEEMLRFLYGGM